jgi:putative transposase
VTLIKSLTTREILSRCPQVKKQLWGGEFWSDGYFISTVGLHANVQTISDYVHEQGTDREYQQLHTQQFTLALFEQNS